MSFAVRSPCCLSKIWAAGTRLRQARPERKFIRQKPEQQLTTRADARPVDAQDPCEGPRSAANLKARTLRITHVSACANRLRWLNPACGSVAPCRPKRSSPALLRKDLPTLIDAGAKMPQCSAKISVFLDDANCGNRARFRPKALTRITSRRLGM